MTIFSGEDGDDWSGFNSAETSTIAAAPPTLFTSRQPSGLDNNHKYDDSCAGLDGLDGGDCLNWSGFKPKQIITTATRK